MGQVTASVTIGFITAASNGAINTSFQAEVDSREDGLNGGKSQFLPGDSIAILLFKGSNVSGVLGTPSAGTLAQGSTITITKSETVTMAYSDTFNTQYPITGSYSISWFGASSPAVTQTSETSFSSSSKQIAVGTITYQTTAQVWSLSGVPVDYPAAVAIFFGTTP